MSASCGEASSATSPEGRSARRIATATSPVSSHLGGEAREAGGAVHPGHPAGDLDPALDERGEIRERPGIEVSPPHPGPGQGLGRVGEVVIGLAADDLEKRHPFARPGQGLADGGRLGERPERLQASAPLDGPRLLQEERPDAVELQCFE